MSFVGRNHPQQVAVRGPLDEVDDRTTPWDFFTPLAQRFGGFTLDAAAAPHNARCDRYYTRHDNGLMRTWERERGSGATRPTPTSTNGSLRHAPSRPGRSSS